MNSRVIALVGPRGAGKSTVGPRVAARLSLHYRDADLEIETCVGMGVSELLRQRGEAEFRRIEDEVSSRLLDQSGVVVALGGGGVLCPGVFARLGAGRVFCVFLHAPVATLVARLAEEPRPPLTGLPLAEEVAALLAQRLPRYRNVAALEVDTSAVGPDECARRIEAALRSI